MSPTTDAKIVFRKALGILRLSQGMSRNALARAARISAGNLSNYERGLSLLREETLARLMKTLGLPLDAPHRAEEFAEFPAGRGRHPAARRAPDGQAGRGRARSGGRQGGRARHPRLPGAGGRRMAGGLIRWSLTIESPTRSPLRSGASGSGVSAGSRSSRRWPGSARESWRPMRTASSAPACRHPYQLVNGPRLLRRRVRPPPGAMGHPRRLKVTTFTARASQEQARRWALVARWLKCRSVAAWLEEMAEEQSKRLDEAAADAVRRGGSLKACPSAHAGPEIPSRRPHQVYLEIIGEAPRQVPANSRRYSPAAVAKRKGASHGGEKRAKGLTSERRR
jgi:transcriptional regulator with XRE-family HTH domain